MTIGQTPYRPITAHSTHIL